MKGVVVATVRALLYRAALGAVRLLPARASPRRFPLAILKLDRLGDAVLSLGAVRRLLQGRQEAETLLVVSDIAAPLFQLEFPKAALVVLPPFCSRFWPDYLLFLSRHGPALSGITADKLVCLRHQPSDYLSGIAALLSPKVCHASETVSAWEARTLHWPSPVSVPYPEAQAPDQVCLELEAHRRVVQSACGQPIGPAAVLPQFTSVRPLPGGALLVCPLAGDVIRQYPPAALAAALRQVLAAVSLPVQFCLPPGVDKTPWSTALAAAGVACDAWHAPASVADLLHLVAGSRAVLAPESAPAHIACALDKPGVFILGGGHHGMFAPWTKSPRQVWLAHPMDCYHCRWHCRHPEPYCITRISVQEVASAMLQVLQ